MVAQYSWRATLMILVFSLTTGASGEWRARAASLPRERVGGRTLSAGGFRCDMVTYRVNVNPQGGGASYAPYTNGHTSTFTVTNTGLCQDTYTFTSTATGPISGVTLSPASLTLAPQQQGTVTATYNVGTPGNGVLTTTGILTMTARGSSTVHASASGYYNVTVAWPTGTPAVDASPYDFDNQDYSRCADACFAATMSWGTVPYFSLDAPRRVVLAYNGDRVNPHPFVLVNVTPDPNQSGSPSQYRLQVKVNGVFVTFVNTEQTLYFNYPGYSPARIGGQFDASAYPTGVDSMDILVSAVYGASVLTNDVKTTLTVVSETSSPVARGWSIAGIQRLYGPYADSSALVVEGDGSAVYFSHQSGSFRSPAGEFSVLVPSTLSGSSGWARLYPDSTKVAFNSAGLMTTVWDRFNNRDSVAYDASNRVSQIFDPFSTGNYWITLSYGSSGLSSIRDPLGRVTNVTVDGSGRLTAVTDPDNVSTRFGYDGNLRLDSLTDRRGATTVLSYDAASGTLATVTGPQVSIFGGGAVSPVTTFIPWLKGGVPYSLTASAPLTPPRADTVRATVTEPGGAVGRFTVNRWGTPAQAINALAETTTVTFDGNGMPIRTVYPTGGVDTAGYNASGLITYHQAPGLTGTNILYAAYGVVDSIWGTGQVAAFAFVGANGRIDSTRFGGVAVTRYHYEPHGRVDSIIDPQQHLLVRSYFAGLFGNRSKDSTLGPRVTTHVYDTYGRDSLLRSTGLPTLLTLYDQVNRVTQVYDSVNPNPTQYAYDQIYLASVTDPKGQVFRIKYNSLGWTTSRTDPAGDSTTYQYSVDGDLRRLVNARGQNVDFGYDALHRATSKAGVNTPSESWQYTGQERVLTATSPASTETVYLNVSGLQDSAKTSFAGLTPTFTRAYRYTAAGLRDTLLVTGGGISFQPRSYGYDTGRGALTGMGIGSATTQLSVNNDGLPTSIRLPGQDTVTYAWTATHQSMSITTNAQYAFTAERQLSYDSVGRVRMQMPGPHYLADTANRADTASQYTYDGLNRLLVDSAELNGTQMPPGCTDSLIGNRCVNWIHTYWVPTGRSSAYSYDSANNRRDLGGSYSAGDRVTAFNGCTYGTDADGNISSRSGCLSQTVNFVWQAESQLDSMNVNGTGVKLYYDAHGRLVRKDVNGAAVSYFLWDGNNLLAELNGSATQLKAEYSYYPSADNLHAIVVSGHKYYAHADGIGNVIALTDSAQFVQRGYEYNDWGQLIAGNDLLGFNGVDRARWKGALWLGPEIELYYMRSRWYEPLSGRFLSEDPAGLAGGINPYVFGGGDPVNTRDPAGLRYSVAAIENSRDWCGWVCDVMASGPYPGGTQLGLFGPGADVPGGVSDVPEPPAQSPPVCGAKGFGGGFGVTGDVNGDLGVSAAGATANGFIGGGLFYDSKTGFSDGIFRGGAALAYFLGHVAAAPAQSVQPVIVGAYAGGGASIFFTNARSVQQLGGPFVTYAANIGYGPMKFSVRYASAGSIGVLSISPPRAGQSYGISFTRTVTNTNAQQRGCK